MAQESELSLSARCWRPPLLLALGLPSRCRLCEERAKRTAADLLNDQSLSVFLRLQLESVHLWVNCNDYFIPGEEALFGHSREELEALSSLAVALGLTNVLLFATPESAALTANLDAVETDVQILSDELSPDSVTLLLRREVKAKGLLNYLLLLPPSITRKLLASMEEENFRKLPITLIWSESAARVREFADFPVFPAIFLTETGCESALRKSDVLACKLSNRLSSGARSYSVLAWEGGSPVVVGSIREKQVSLCSGCLSSRNKNSQATTRIPLQISFNNGTLNPDGDTDNGEKEWYLGADLAVLDINSGTSILPNHLLKVFNVTLGLNRFSFDWVMKQLANLTRDDFGLVFMDCDYSSVTVALYDVLGLNLSWTIPQVASDVLTPVLSSSARYPLFSRVIVSTDYFSVLYVNLLKRYNWRRVAVLYSDDLFGRGMYKAFKVLADEAGIEIVNPEDRRGIPNNMDEYPTERIPDYQQIVDSKVRIVLLIVYGSATTYSIDVFYDLGIRRGDMLFLGSVWLMQTIFTIGTEDSIRKRKELLHGALQFYPVSFYSDFGQDIERRYLATFGFKPAGIACYYYDGILSVAHALDFLITKGDVYESPTLLAKELKRVRFTGCTGQVTMQEGTNDRYLMIFEMFNAIVSEQGHVDIKRVAYYNPTGLLLFNFTSPITWPDNTAQVPSDSRTSALDCPFEEKEIVAFLPGLLLADFIVLFIALVVIVMTVCIWRRFWKEPVRELKQREVISFDDYILFATIGLEALQYVAMGPALPSSTWLISTASDLVGSNFDRIVNLSHGVFWVVLNSAYGAVAAWVLLIGATKMQLSDRLGCLFSWTDDASEKLLPILGNLCFLPVFSMLLNVFLCLEAISHGGKAGFASTFLMKDCYQTCWVVPHALYAVASALALVLYVPLAVYLRPSWQDFQPALHVHTSPSYLMTKTLYQVSLLIARDTVGYMLVSAHAFIYIVLTTTFFVLTWKWRPYGYARANLWHAISLICVLLLAVISTLDLFVGSSSHLLWNAVFFSASGLCIAFGMVYQTVRLPSLLYRPKGRDIETLFRFQLSSNTKVLDIFKSQSPAEVSFGRTGPGLKLQQSARSPSDLPRLATDEESARVAMNCQQR